MVKTVRKLLIPVLLLCVLPPGPGAEDRRRESLDMLVVIDGSAALKNVREAALNWFSERVVERILQDGDRLSVWIAGDQAELVFSGTFAGEESRKTLLDRLRAVETARGDADFTGALRELSLREAAIQGSLPPYILLITGTSGGFKPSPEGSAGRLLRYSRVEEFPGWRALRLAGSVGGRVRDAASAYLKTEG
jgi:hypothetical protein